MKKLPLFIVGLVLLYGIYFFGSGFNVRNDVHLIDFAAPAHGEDITIHVGVSSSAGYTRTWRNVSDDPTVMDLEFYSAFGGINGSVGADDRFAIPLHEDCKEIRFMTFGDFRTVLVKDPVSGQWNYVQ